MFKNFKINLNKILISLLVTSVALSAQIKKDTLSTDSGPLVISFIGHASLIFEYKGKVIHIDPWSKKGDYSRLPKADAALITHGHPDHLDLEAIGLISKPGTKFYANTASAGLIAKAKALKNYDEINMEGISLKALPAYNLIHKRESGEFFHPKGEGNGYLFEFGSLKILVAGDTENIPELKELKNLDVAFLPMNLPYTMTPEMVADLVFAIKPKIFYPYHTGKTDKNLLTDLLKDLKDVDIRIVEGM